MGSMRLFLLFLTDNAPISPTRWLFSTLVPILLMAYGLKRKAVNYNGAALGLIIAIALSLANHAFLACLATFFFSSSRVTKFRSHLKRKIESDFKGGNVRLKHIHLKCPLIFSYCACHLNTIKVKESEIIV